MQLSLSDLRPQFDLLTSYALQKDLTTSYFGLHMGDIGNSVKMLYDFGVAVCGPVHKSLVALTTSVL